MERRADETFEEYRIRRTQEDRRVRERLDGVVVAYGPGYNRQARRKVLEERLPRGVCLLLTKLAELSADVNFEHLAMVYLTEPVDRRPEAVGKFQKLLLDIESGEFDEDV